MSRLFHDEWNWATAPYQKEISTLFDENFLEIPCGRGISRLSCGGSDVKSPGGAQKIVKVKNKKEMYQKMKNWIIISSAYDSLLYMISYNVFYKPSSLIIEDHTWPTSYKCMNSMYPLDCRILFQNP